VVDPRVPGPQRSKRRPQGRFRERRAGYHDGDMTRPGESPASRTDAQEVAAGRTAATPVAVIGRVAGVIAAAAVVVAALVVLGYALA
jgi:hypothetical protein